MVAPTPPSPPKGKDIGISPFPPPPPSASNLVIANNTNFARNQDNTTLYSRETSIKVETEDPIADTTTATTKPRAGPEPDAYGVANGDEDDMPRPRPQPVKREADIHLILTPPQRLDFTRLSDEIQVKVFEHITKATKFLDHPKAQVGRVQIWNYAPAVKAAREAQETEEDDMYSGDPQPGEIQGDAQKKAPKPIKIDVDSVEATVSSMSVLRDEQNAYFAKWKSTFNKRFADLIVTNQSNFSGGPPRQGQGAPRGGAMAGSRVQQPGMFQYWSHLCKFLREVAQRGPVHHILWRFWLEPLSSRSLILFNTDLALTMNPYSKHGQRLSGRPESHPTISAN